MSDLIAVAIITAVSGVIGGIIGAIASPRGKDWVAKHAFDREESRLAGDRERAEVEVEKARERHMYDDLTTALEVWRAVAPLVAYNSTKEAEQYAAQERVRALAPRITDDVLRKRLTALVNGDAVSFWELHGPAVERLGEIVRDL